MYICKKYLKKYENETAKAAFWFVIASVIQKALSFITVPVFTRVMSKEQYGLYSSYLSWTSVVSVFLTLRIGAGVYSNVLGKENEKFCKDEMAVSLVSLCFTIITVSFLLFLIFQDYIIAFAELPFTLFLLMFLEIYSIPTIELWTYEQRFNYKYKLLVLFTLAKSFINVSLGIWLVVYSPVDKQAESRVLSMVLLETISMLAIYLYFANRRHKLFFVLNWTKIIKFQLPLIPHAISMTLLFTSDRIMIQKIIGLSEAGIYSVAYSAGQIMTIFESAISDAMRPWIYEKINKREYKSISYNITLISTFVCLIAFVFSVVAPELIYIFAGKSYYAAIYVIPPVALSAVFTFLYDIFIIIETYYGVTKSIMLASVTAALTNIVLNYLLIPKYGFVVARYTTLFSYILLSVFHYINVRIIGKKHTNKKKLFGIMSLLVISVVGGVGCILVSLIYDYVIIRYFVLLLFCVLYIVFKKLSDYFGPKTYQFR